MRKDIKHNIDTIHQGEIPEGYKNTRWGIRPYTWNNYYIKDIFKKVGTPVKVESDMEYIQIGIRSHGRGLFIKEPVTGRELGNKAVFWIEPDCLVVNIVFAWEQAFAKTTQNEEGLIGSHRFPMYRPISDKVCLDYILHFFMTQRGKSLLEGASPGGAGRNKTLGQDRFSKSIIIIPDIKEQQKIAEILNHCDKVIELKRRLIKAEISRKKWLLQNLLNPKSGIRLPGFDDEWVYFNLGKNGKTYGGLTGKKAEDFGKGKPYISYVNIHQNHFIDETMFDYVRLYPSENQNCVQYGDIFFTTSSETPEEVGMSAVYLGNNEELYLNSFSFGLRLDDFDRLSPEFAAYYFNCTYFKRILYRLAQGATRYNLSKTDLMKQSILIPPTILEQKKISRLLIKYDYKISLLEKDLVQWQQKKKALMQLLLTGIVRVTK